MNPGDLSTSRRIVQIRDGVANEADDRLATEEPLEIRIGKEPLAITMRTPGPPGSDADLAAGFCLTEGIIERGEEIESIEPCKIADYGNVVIVTLTDDAMTHRREQIACGKREMYMSSSCGLCGKQSIDRIEKAIKPIVGRFTVSPQTLSSLPDRMRAAQSTFEATGGLHAAALFTPTGELRVLREDVGRHNAVDKVIGAALLDGQVPIDPAILLVSGRSSFEIMQKAAMAGIAFVAAVSAPSSLAAEMAERFGITLVGFLRPGRMNVYHDRGRIAG